VALPLAERNLASLISEGDRMSWSKDAAPIYLGLAEAELAQGREQEALEVFEWYLGAAQRAGVSRRGGVEYTRGGANAARATSAAFRPDCARLRSAARRARHLGL